MFPQIKKKRNYDLPKFNLRTSKDRDPTLAPTHCESEPVAITLVLMTMKSNPTNTKTTNNKKQLKTTNRQGPKKQVTKTTKRATEGNKTKTTNENEDDNEKRTKKSPNAPKETKTNKTHKNLQKSNLMHLKPFGKHV